MMDIGTKTVERLFSAMDGTKGLPTRESNVVSIVSKLADDRYGTRDVVGHIIEDFSLTQRVLKLANSAMYASFSRGIGKVSSALEVLGTDAMMHLVLSASLATDEEIENDPALAKTLLSSELARNICKDRPEEASISALMFDLGFLMVQRFLPNESLQINRKVMNGSPLNNASLEIIGLTLEELGIEIAKRWRLPLSLTSIIDGSGDPVLVAIARFSSAASSLIYAGDQDRLNQLIASLDIENIDKNEIANFVRFKNEQIKSTSNQPPVVQRDFALHQLYSDVKSAGHVNAELLADSIFSNLSDILHTAHGLLFVRLKSGDFCVRYGHGRDIDRLRSVLRITADQKPTAFHAAIRNNVDLSISAVSRMKIASLPDRYSELLPNVTQFLLLPISHTAPSGLLYLDWETETPLSTSEMTAIKRLRDLFIIHFRH